ncbi:MAG: hypothetical protein IJZ55_08410 [Lachnospiraceae bacterium]|nr:hypothetical protein [Lachnospiraceae bacterium]
MTLFDLTSSQKQFLLENLFDYSAMKKAGKIPTHIMFYIDKHIGITGFLFLSKNMQGVQYAVTDFGMEGSMLSVSQTNEMIAYMNSKKFTLLPTDSFQTIKKVIIQQGRSR